MSDPSRPRGIVVVAPRAAAGGGEGPLSRPAHGSSASSTSSSADSRVLAAACASYSSYSS